MGRKYAAVCVRADGQEKERLQEAWKEALNAGDPAMTGDVVRFSEKIGAPADKKQAALMRLFANAYRAAMAGGGHVLERQGFFSFYDSRLSFENVGSMALRLSTRIDAPLFFAAVYDDDVYIFGICERGAVLGKSIAGEGCASYGQQPQDMEARAWAAFFSGGEAAVLAGLRGEALEKKLEALLGFALERR